MPKPRGLPDNLRMRHDAHYVETLAAPGGVAIGRMVPIESIDPNPDQPRQAMGDLGELVASITEKGIIEPLIVRQRGARYQIIAGERRYHASVQAKLSELPVVIRDVDDGEMMELALIENIQRKDLTPFEESEAMGGLAQKFGYTHEDLAKRLGKSRTTITEALSLNTIPPEVRKVCRLAGINNRSLLLQVVRQGDPQKMLALVEKITSQGATREQLRKEADKQKPKAGRPKSFVFAFRPATKAFNLRLQFNKRNASKDEVISALEEIIKDLKKSK
ncbi:MAG TPA: ParB/RepB/Spo0J family partition protein [Vicinamibacterales bacterium]|nr:ParB/RepB/Spo0J family partition protein [Vicinamibacterales bacterium]